MTHGVLLVNLGTPDSPKEKDVKRYLKEFLTDGRVIDIPYLQRQILVRGIIVPKRFRESAKLYQSIWKKEGSPLLVYGKEVEKLLQTCLGDGYHVRLAMRYQNPSIKNGLEALRGCNELTILPLFPQYASATTGSVYQKVFDVLRKWQVIPPLRFIGHFEKHPAFINAFAAVSKKYAIEDYDHILFSYHGLPERQLKKGDFSGQCLKKPDCCERNPSCYAAQCLATTRALTKKLMIPEDKWSHCYQSRLGKDPWVQPYTSTVLDEMIEKGKKRVLVFCPAFVCDCLETLEEIKCTYRDEFLKKGGECLDLVEGLNSNPEWIAALEELVKNGNLSRS